MTPWWIHHPENTVQVRPGLIMRGYTPARTVRSPGWWKQSRTHAPHRTTAGSRGGGAFFLPETERQQRILVKPTVAVNHGPRSQSWYRHGVYLQRDGAQQEGRGLGFDAERDDVNLSTTLARWQREGDPHMFKVILSPEHSTQLNLPQFARDLMHEVEQDLGVRPEWAAIDHYNTNQPHLHLLIRGRDLDGQVLRLDGGYLWGGLRNKARSLVTQRLGMRSTLEIDRAREQAVSRQHWSELDHALRARMSQERKITVDRRHPLTPHERQRLHDLVHRGLAWQNDEQTWEMSQRWEELKTESGRQTKQEEDTRPEPRRRIADEKERKTEQEKGEREEEEEQQRRLVRMDDLEHELGWER
jgi:type IV secretory pathway VirD2 relaxase